MILVIRSRCNQGRVLARRRNLEPLTRFFILRGRTGGGVRVRTGRGLLVSAFGPALKSLVTLRTLPLFRPRRKVLNGSLARFIGFSVTQGHLLCHGSLSLICRILGCCHDGPDHFMDRSGCRLPLRFQRSQGIPGGEDICLHSGGNGGALGRSQGQVFFLAIQEGIEVLCLEEVQLLLLLTLVCPAPLLWTPKAPGNYRETGASQPQLRVSLTGPAHNNKLPRYPHKEDRGSRRVMPGAGRPAPG